MSYQSQRQPSIGSPVLDRVQLQQPDSPGAEDVHYTTYIRLPFPRHDFVDPPLVTWPAQKDRELWRILSQAPPGRHGTSSELEWKRLAAQFDVSLAFILQQAAWLYERQLSQVKAQMRKVGGGRPLSGNYSATGASGGGGSMSGSPNPAGGRGASAERMSPSPSSNVVSRGFDAGQDDSNTEQQPGVAKRPSTISRIPSTATVTQSMQFPGFRAGSAQDSRGGTAGASQAPSLQQREWAGAPVKPDLAAAQSQGARMEDVLAVDNLAGSSSESDEDAADSGQAFPVRSQLFRRPVQPRRGGPGKVARHSEDVDSDSDSDEGPTFMPLSAAALDGTGEQDMRATVRTADEGSKASSDEADANTTAAAAKDDKGKRTEVTRASSNMSEASSVSSAGPLASADSQERRAAALSPRQQAELKGRAGSRKEGSEGTPSMGSSFSDLEDTSVTQSAMEEYYLSKMQHGAASRMSNFSQALKSKYLPQQQQQQQHQR